jgi:hypothetical protein
MLTRRSVGDALVTLALASAMHVDWHVARPPVHHLSLGWRWHWLLAVPVFALTAWYVASAWPTRVWGKSLAILLAASIVAGVLEPAWEYWIDGATFEWAFGALRLTPFFAFLAVGLVTHAIVLAVALRRRR